MAIFVVQSEDFKLGKNGTVTRLFGDSLLTLEKEDGTTARYPLSTLTYLKQQGSTDHHPTTPSLTAAAQSIGTTVAVTGAFLGGSVTGGLLTALIGSNIVHATQKKHESKIAKTTYLLQVGFHDNATAFLEVDDKEYQHFAKQFSRFALI